MRRLPTLVLLAVLGACAGPPPGGVAPASFALPESTYAIDGTTGRPVGAADLVERLRGADFVLLGEVHDNPVHHELRGALIAALAPGRAVVFEQFAASGSPIPPPTVAEDRDAWLDRHGFDRKNWRWPLHRPVVDAAIAHGRSIWGSGLSREALRSVVREGASAMPEALRAIVNRSPLDSARQAAMDQTLVEGHCGQLPPAMVPGMRAAQVARDAAMTRALAMADRPAVLIAGNGHVRNDIAVPRLLRPAFPAARVIAVGSLEREPGGAPPGPAARALYDLVIVTPRVDRPDPCAGLQVRPPR